MSFEIGHVLETGESFSLKVKDVVASRTYIASETRFGKSHTARRIIEKCFGQVGIIIIDPEGEYSSLREKYSFIIIGRDVPMEVETQTLKTITAELMAEQILETKTSAIIDLSVSEDIEAGKDYVDTFLRRFFHLQTTARQPYLIIWEEAEDFAPESGAPGSRTCLEVAIAYARRGGKRGIGIIFVGHRPAWISKGILSQCPNKAIGRIESTDMKALEEYARIPRNIVEKLVPKTDEGGNVVYPGPTRGEFCFTGDWVEKTTFVKVGPVETTHLGCFTPDVKVLTPEGPKVYSDCKVGDLVWSLNLKDGNMEPKPIRQIHEYDYDDLIYQVRGKRVNIAVTPNHRMLIRTRHRPSWFYEVAGAALERYEFYVPVSADWFGKKQPRLKLRPPRQHKINGRMVHSKSSWELYFLRRFSGHIRKDKVSKIPYNGKVWCFTVQDNDNFMVMQNGTAMFSGNSTPEIIPPSPKEITNVIENLRKMLPSVIEKIKPAIASKAELESKIKSELEGKYKSRIEAILKTADEKAERKYKVRIDQLQEQLEKLSRSQALQPTTPITDVLEHPIVKARMLQLEDKARDLLTWIEREPGHTREELAARMVSSKDVIASMVNKINRTFQLQVIIGDGKPIRYRSMLKRLFITDVAKREIEELGKLQAHAKALEDEVNTLRPIAQQSTVLRDEVEHGRKVNKELFERLEKRESEIKELLNQITILTKENEAYRKIKEGFQTLGITAPSVDIEKRLDAFRKEVVPEILAEVKKIGLGPRPISATPIDEKKLEELIDRKMKEMSTAPSGTIPTSVELEHKVTHFDYQKMEERLHADTTTLQGRLIFLITKGFFDNRHNRKEIVTELSNNGWVHGDKEVDTTLLELCGKGIFYRKISTGNVFWFNLQEDAKERIHT